MPLSPVPIFHALLSAWDAWLLTLLVGIVLPAFAFFLYRRLRAAPGDGASVRRQIYGTVIVSEWLLVAGLAYVAHRHNLSITDLGQHLRHPHRLLGITLVLVAVFGILVFQNLRELKGTTPEALAKHLGKARKFIPSGKVEILAWAAMALTAGICEELLFRGWMLPLFGSVLGSLWLGLLISSLLFGLAHAYQGPKGILTTGLVGLVLGLIYMGAGSLVPSQVLHALVNLVHGFIGASLVARTGGKKAEGL